jgi:hypothetical protein
LVADADRASLSGTATSVDRLPPGSYTFQIEARDAAGGRVAQSDRAQVTLDGAGNAVSTVLSTAAAGVPAVTAPWTAPSAAVAPGIAPPALAAPGMAAPAVVAPGMVPPSAALGAPPAALAVPPAAGPGGVPPPSLGPPGATGAGFPLTARPTGPDSARLEWPMLPGATSYAVYQAQGSTPLAFAFSTGQGNTTLSGLTNAAGYTFQVRARNAADQELGASVTVTLEPTQ